MMPEASYLKVVRAVYAEAAAQAQPKLCCTTSSLRRLPGLVVLGDGVDVSLPRRGLLST